MPPIYLPAPHSAFRQGELLANFFEHRAVGPARDLTTEPVIDPPPFQPYQHPWLIVLTPDCDLDQDYKVRVPDEAEALRPDFEQRRGRRLIEHVMLCPGFLQSEIRGRLAPGSGIWDGVRNNQNVRYHRVEGGVIASTEDRVPELFVDFSRVFTIPASGLYGALESATVRRVAVTPPVYVHALIQRFFAFQSRIGLPDE